MDPYLQNPFNWIYLYFTQKNATTDTKNSNNENRIGFTPCHPPINKKVHGKIKKAIKNKLTSPFFTFPKQIFPLYN